MVAVDIIPPDEEQRLAAVRRYGILDTPPDGAFDRIAQVAARLFDVPIAIVSVVDSDRIWFKSHHGVDATEIGRDPGLCASAILGSEPWVVTDAARDPRTLSNPLVASDFGLRFYAGAPLTTHDGYNLGTLCVIDRAPRTVTERESQTLVDLAALVVNQLEVQLSARRAVASTSRQLEEMQGMARALQASLLPPALPRVPYVEAAATYHPASRFEVGGDFYDAFPIDDRTWGLVIGDVCGKGPEAAGRTSCARYSMRAAAIHEAQPAEVLRVVNRALLADAGPGVEAPFVTALFARLEPDPRGTTVHLSSAGHPLPTVVTGDGAVRTFGTPGSLLGVFDEVEVADATVRLEPGDTLVLVTDGVLDSGRPQRLLQSGLEGLLAGSQHVPVDALVHRVHDAVAASQRDDIAILAVRAAP